MEVGKLGNLPQAVKSMGPTSQAWFPDRLYATFLNVG